MSRSARSIRWLPVGLFAAAAVLLAPASVRAQASGVLQARVQVLDVRPKPEIPDEWVQGPPRTGADRLRLDRPGQPERLEIQAMPDSGTVAMRRLQLTVTYLR